MEVGAVKQAFNNDVIQLKKNLNQAKIQVIHKLTRKAKTLTEKKTPDHLKEKMKKKAESAVKEVLIMKKLKPRDLARFIITHKGELNSHLNKPDVDNDKACARLLLHKSLQQKYKSMKNTFGNIPIKDLLMSRQERIKLKKEAKELQKNRKKSKGKNIVNAEGDWNVEDVMNDDGNAGKNDDDRSQQNDDDSNVSDNTSQGNDNDSDDCSQDGVPADNKVNVNVSDDENQFVSDDDDDTPIERRDVVNDSDESSDDGQSCTDNNDQDSVDDHFGLENDISHVDGNNEKQDSDEEMENTENKVKRNPLEETKSPATHNFLIPQSEPKHTPKLGKLAHKPKEKKKDVKVRENKNKNLKDKMLNRKFKKDADDNQNQQKIVDPFFKTATGENYMSLAEPRQPDEVKEIHSQGNRRERRAVMFGNVPNFKPRRDNFRQNNSTGNNRNENTKETNEKFHNINKFNSNDKSGHYSSKNGGFRDRNTKFNDSNSKFNDRGSKFNDRSSNFHDSSSKFIDRNFNKKVIEPKEEKLHPSWEAKKKQSGIQPFKGKKIVFD